MRTFAANRWRVAVLALVGCAIPFSPALASELRVLGTSQFGGELYRSNARTMGGVGGGLGARLSFRNRWLMEVSAGLLAGAGQVQWLHAAVGIQRDGTYCPALLFGSHVLFGDALHFLTPQHRLIIEGPAFSAGVTLVPLRWRANDTELTIGTLYLGLGSDLPGTAWAYGMTLAEVGVSL